MLMIMLAALAAPVDPTGADVACILSPLRPEERARLSGVPYGQARPSGAMEPLERAAMACRRTRGWSEDRMQEIVMTAYAVMVAERGAALLQAAGIDPAVVDRWFEQQPESARFEESMARLDIEALTDTLQAGTAGNSVLDNVQLIVTYVRTRVGIERLRRGLTVG